MELSNFVAIAKNSKLDVDRFCKIKTYLTVQEKIDFIQEYYKTLNSFLSTENYTFAEQLVAFTIFNLMVVKAYTDIQFEISLESMDLLQENNLINKIIAKISADYEMLLKFIEIR